MDFQIGKYYVQRNNIGQWIVSYNHPTLGRLQVAAPHLEDWIAHYIEYELFEPIQDCAYCFRMAFRMRLDDFVKSRYGKILDHLELRELSEQEKMQGKQTVRLILSWFVQAYNLAFGTNIHSEYVYPFVSDMEYVDRGPMISMVSEHTFNRVMSENATE